MRLRRTLSRGALGTYRFFVRGFAKLFSLSVGGAFAEFGKNSVIQLPVRLVGEHRIAIGSNVFFASGGWLQVVENGEPSDEVALRIGDGCAFAGGCVLSAVKSLTLGRNVVTARNCYIADHSHAYTAVGVPTAEQGLTDILPVVIEDDVWLGQNVVILPGVRIGRGAVVGANSVVHSDVPSYSVAVGIPARIVRRFGEPNDAGAE